MVAVDAAVKHLEESKNQEEEGQCKHQVIVVLRLALARGSRKKEEE